MLEIVRIPVLSDNYVWLVHEAQSGETLVVDPAVAAPVLAAAEARGWTITQIWNTHWHPDHVGGNAEIKVATGCIITGPAAEAERIPTLDVHVRGGDVVQLGDVREGWERTMSVPIEGDVHVPMSQMMQGDRSGFAALDPAATTIVYCAVGQRSLAVARVLREQMGFRSVGSLRGGIQAWHAVG